MTYPFDGLTIIIHNGNQDWSKNPPRSEEEDRIRVYLEDMQKANPNDMISEIAMKASKEYKDDPKIISKTEELSIILRSILKSKQKNIRIKFRE